ncbi:MAG: indolepyruvate oxidoreductase subunit beta [Clostridiales bacterium]|jgi:indolepyruvate ferredoxin oxidoreductase beta subunit|nr:indolepyruvate oxidoreductase subunit beta [Clostridiales bacterium]
MTNVLIAGVGGQGALFAGRVLGRAAIQAGCDVKISEVHGMSQRGGSVETVVRFDREKVHSPLIDKGGADFILALELLEAYRSIGYLKNGGWLIASTQRIDPMPVITGVASYPADIVEKLTKTGARVKALDALSLAIESGGAKMANVVLIGVLAGALAGDLAIAKEDWLTALRQAVPEKLLAMNLKAFELGHNWRENLGEIQTI